MRKGFLSLWTVLASVSLALAWDSVPGLAGKPARSPSLPQYKDGEVIVKLKKRGGAFGVSSAGMAAHDLLNALGKSHDVSVQPLRTDRALAKIKVKDSPPMGQLLAELQANSDVIEYAEPNWIYHAMDLPEGDPLRGLVPNDPGFNKNWGLLNTGQADSKGQAGFAGHDIGATKAWAYGTGSKEIVVAVIDTGVDYNHEDLKNNIFINTKEDPSNGKDNDGNGFVNDWHGWNFEGKNNDPMDDNRHGTHVAGTIGAEGDNGVGTAGVNWHVSILPIKFLSASGSGSLEDAVEAIKYATLMGVKIMSNSWGGGGFSQTMADAIKDARAKGILFVAAAGNEGTNNDEAPSYPASYNLDNVISVAATDNRDQKAPWSNHGRRTVHLAAPGVNIYSTAPASKGSYDTLSGTSMACPHVSGAAALLWSLNMGMTYGEIRERLLRTVDPVRYLGRRTASGGRLNIYNAIQNIVPPRGAPPAAGWKELAKAIESPHPYGSGSNLVFEISHPGAKFMRVHFSKVSTEPGYDVVSVRDSQGTLIDDISGEAAGYTTEFAEGDRLAVTFTSDGSVENWGFAIDKYEFID